MESETVHLGYRLPVFGPEENDEDVTGSPDEGSA